MKILSLFIISLFIGISAQAQLMVKNTWTKALLTSTTVTAGLSTDTIHKSITDVQADSLIKANDSNDNFVILDVRTAGEFIAGHIKNAENIDFYDSNFNSMINDLDRDLIYLVYCGSGYRSGQAYNLMVSMKFREVYNMLKGFSKWKADGFPYEVDSATSIENYITNSVDVAIYPNPATDYLTVTWNEPSEYFMISVYNLTGEELLNLPVFSSRSEMNISALPSGMYLLKLTGSNKAGSHLFIKQ